MSTFGFDPGTAESRAVRALLKSRRPARTKLSCPSHHLLGKVYEIDGNRRLAVPDIRILAAELDEIVPEDSRTEETIPAWAYPLDAARDEYVVLRCRCGSWSANLADLSAQVAAGKRQVIITVPQSRGRKGALVSELSAENERRAQPHTVARKSRRRA